MDNGEFYHALVAAAILFKNERISALIAQGADINYAPPDEMPVLHRLIHYQTDKRYLLLDTIQNIIHLGANVNLRTLLVGSPLAMACAQCDAEIVEMLLKGGARFHMPGKDLTPNSNRQSNVFFNNPMFLKKGCQIIKLLAKYGKDVDMHRNQNGETLLDFCCRINCESLITCLLECGANPNRHSIDEEKTPLHFAAHHVSVNNMRLLLKYGADVSLTDTFGRTAIDEAIYHFQPYTAQYILEHYVEQYKELLPKWPVTDDLDLRGNYVFRRGMQTRLRNNC